MYAIVWQSKAKGWISMVLYDTVRLNMVILWLCMSQYVPVNIIMYGPIWPSMTAYGREWESMASYGWTWRNMAEYKKNSLEWTLNMVKYGQVPRFLKILFTESLVPIFTSRVSHLHQEHDGSFQRVRQRSFSWNMKRTPNMFLISGHYVTTFVFVDYVTHSSVLIDVSQISALKNHERIDRYSNLKWLSRSAKKAKN